jgi:hypothetical protein
MVRQIIICLKLVFASDIYVWRNLLGAVKLRLRWRSETVMKLGEGAIGGAMRLSGCFSRNFNHVK